MKIKDIAALMYDNEEAQLVCIQNIKDENDVYFIGYLDKLRRDHPKLLKADIITMYTEKYGSYYGADGLTISIKEEF